MGTTQKDLNPINNEAIKIARHLVEEVYYTEEETIRLAVKEGKEWFLDTQG